MMKLAIYGVSRAGKDYLIKNVIAHLHETTLLTAIHIEGSKTLNALAQEMFQKTFKSLDESNKNTLREKFTEIVNKKNSEYDLVLVDGHYSFIDGDYYKVVFTEQDENVYDHFFYLDTPSELIVEFSRKSTGEKRNLDITVEQVRNWKKFEKFELDKICNNHNKELVILDEETESSVKFISFWLDSYLSKFCNQTSALSFYKENKELLNKSTQIILVDCDKTVSINDGTYDFCRYLEIKKEELKSIFRNDRYTSYQFFKVWNLYKSKNPIKIGESVTQTVQNINLSQSVFDYLMNQKDSIVIGVTSGVFDIWNLINEKYKIFDVLLGNTCKSEFEYLVTPLFKKEIASLLREKGKHVVAIGDSMIDIPMLEAADQGYLIAHEKLNKAVESYLTGVECTNIKQIFDIGVSYNLENAVN
ncbi:AAA family ATPase [Vibrio mimicus]|uniref:AAA family ATPase n=3 Tax=Vibrio mimicus TaxID=674 RepID=UPI000E1B7064|nr:AAA family ATPase [Vibrio mimicus]MBY7725711.1 HAD hydrolase family protein [Vibrio mimicus]TXY31204.1 HAD hydrolase family protein [Vibrio mimicus]